MDFWKYHGLGNDYLVMDPARIGRELTRDEIQLICHRNYGPGSDGILWGPLPATSADFALRIFNPDGSEAEKSGNGLRIFSAFLFDQKLVGNDTFTIQTLGGRVHSRVHEGGQQIDVEMGTVSFDSTVIPVAGPPRQVLNETITVGGETLLFCAASIGNPHCVVPVKQASAEFARRIGPLLEVEPRFPNRTNVQFLEILGRNDIRIEIWERGAGYTLASGSSSSAAAAVARKLGHCDRAITVHMPGGNLGITVEDDFSVQMTGPVTRVAHGTIHPDAFTQKLGRN
jgi:diaminopimelate epimerase